VAHNEEEARLQIVEIGRLVWQKGWVAANDGNISVRLGEDRMLCTPTCVSKGRMQPEDLIVCDMQGNKIEGDRGCTSEILLHTTIYGLRPEVGAVVHAHPPVATGFAAAGRPLNLALLPEVIVDLGSVPLAEYGLPGTSEVITPMLPLIPNYHAILMRNHGAVCYGGDIFKAYYRMETVEHFAMIALVAELLGGGRALPRLEVQKLLDRRFRDSLACSKSGDGGPPMTAEDGDQHFDITRDDLTALIAHVVDSLAGEKV
jgi:L-fuculose-phosphate aldolase